MLYELKIENVAVIEKASVQFTEGFNVLTGETGAGKSILIDSINTILGNRTSRGLVRTGAQKAAIWAAFNKLPANIISKIESAGYEGGSELLLYREISADGKSICRINGMPATAAVVRDISSELINIHGQHDNQSLMNPLNHLSVLDAYAQNDKEQADYYSAYKELIAIRREIKSLTLDEDEKAKKLEALQYNINELENAAFKIGEEEELIASKLRVKNAQTILSALNAAYSALSGSDDTDGAVALLGSASGQIESISGISESYSVISERLAELFYSAKDISAEINEVLQNSDFSVMDLDALEERLDLYYKLKKKYNADTLHMLEYLENAKQELDDITFADEKLEKLKAKQRELFAKTRNNADLLTKTRLDAYKRFEEQIVAELTFLNMPGIKLSLEHSCGALGKHGQDSVELYISPNPGETPKPLAKIASGGELSRIMLAIKSAMADKDDIQTVIYDEIDTGVSGLAAGRIGEKLLQTANGRQIICITHTAQIASKAHTHLLIKKNVEQSRTFTSITTLSRDEREKELARIISGDKITELALANAREMLNF